MTYCVLYLLEMILVTLFKDLGQIFGDIVCLGAEVLRWGEEWEFGGSVVKSESIIETPAKGSWWNIFVEIVNPSHPAHFKKLYYSKN